MNEWNTTGPTFSGTSQKNEVELDFHMTRDRSGPEREKTQITLIKNKKGDITRESLTLKT